MYARCVFAVALCAAFLAAVPAAGQPRRGAFTVTYTDPGTGLLRQFDMFVPESYDSTRSYPVLYGWHGAGMPSGVMRQLLSEPANRIDAIIVCPEYNSITTNDEMNRLLTASMFYMQDVYNVDRSRIIVTGFSMGGGLAFQIGLQVPASFGGIIALSPAIASFSDAMWANIASIRMATVLGGLDPAFDLVNSLMTQIPTRGGHLLYLVKPGVEHADAVYYNSQEFVTDYIACYEYVTGVAAAPGEPAESDEIAVWPNPARTTLTVQIPARFGRDVAATLSDLSGRVVANATLGAGVASTIDVSSCPAGVYSLRLTSRAGYTVRRVIVAR